jgi:hypothetical protein
LDVKYDNEDDWQLPNSNIINEIPGDVDSDYDSPESANLFNTKEMYKEPIFKNNRNSRSKEDNTHTQFKTEDQKKTLSKKKNLPDPKYGIYDYENIKMARNRLLHDLNNLPWGILRDTYFKNRESQLRKSKFEQRDITSHIDKIKQNEEVKSIIDEEKKAAANSSYNLWDLESEKELRDKENGYWRKKREVNYTFNGIRKITSVGAILKSSNTTSNAIDIVFITYWQPAKSDDTEMLEQEIKDCLEEKIASGT